MYTYSPKAYIPAVQGGILTHGQGCTPLPAAAAKFTDRTCCSLSLSCPFLQVQTAQDGTTSRKLLLSTSIADQVKLHADMQVGVAGDTSPCGLSCSYRPCGSIFLSNSCQLLRRQHRCVPCGARECCSCQHACLAYIHSDMMHHHRWAYIHQPPCWGRKQLHN